MVFNIDKKKTSFLSTKSASCDTEDLSNGCIKFILPPQEKNCIQKYNKMENNHNISQYYRFTKFLFK